MEANNGYQHNSEPLREAILRVHQRNRWERISNKAALLLQVQLVTKTKALPKFLDEWKAGKQPFTSAEVIQIISAFRLGLLSVGEIDC